MRQSEESVVGLLGRVESARRLPAAALTGSVTAPYLVITPPLAASHSDSAFPVGLEFWLPGKISVLGERGLSFACSHPSCETRKGPLSSSPVYEEHLHWWSAFARVFVLRRSSVQAAAAAAAPLSAGVGFFFHLQLEEEVLKVLDAGASGMWALWEQHHPPTQTTDIDFSVNSTKNKEEQ